jgi:predicted nucleotidyltransferase
MINTNLNAPRTNNAEDKEGAEDLLFIMGKYVDVIDQNDLYDKEATLLEEEGFDNLYQTSWKRHGKNI